MSDINPLKPDFHFDIRDILAAPASALRLKKIFLGALSLLAALAVYNLFTYLAVWAGGGSPGYLFGAEDIFPFDKVRIDAGPARILYGIGIAASVFTLMFGMLAISLVNIEELRGHRLVSAKDGIRFAFLRLRELFYAELSLMALVLFLVALLALLGLVIKIPFIGQPLFAILFLFPGFPIGLFLTLVVLVMLASFFILPAAVSVDRVGETFTCLLEAFSTLMRQPFRWLGYTFASLVSGKICVWVLAGVTIFTIRSLMTVWHFVGGPDSSEVFAGGAKHLPFDGILVFYTTHLWPGLQSLFGVDLFFNISAWGRGGPDSLATYLMSATLLFIFAYVWGYGVSIVATTQSYAYVIIRKLRDDYDVTAEDPLYLQREWINPPVDEQYPPPGGASGKPAADAPAPDDDGLHDNEI